MTTEQIINTLQLVIFVIIFTEFIPQIIKTWKRKSVGDISVSHWILKLVFTTLAIYMLYLTGNTLIVILSQVFNFIFTIIILCQLYVYR